MFDELKSVQGLLAHAKLSVKAGRSKRHNKRLLMLSSVLSFLKRLEWQRIRGAFGRQESCYV
jgi:hypothetical protein